MQKNDEHEETEWLETTILSLLAGMLFAGLLILVLEAV
jgi:tetrahydromethanopterin S-methyltransferase subunit F